MCTPRHDVRRADALSTPQRGAHLAAGACSACSECLPGPLDWRSRTPSLPSHPEGLPTLPRSGWLATGYSLCCICVSEWTLRTVRLAAASCPCPVPCSPARPAPLPDSGMHLIATGPVPRARRTLCRPRPIRITSSHPNPPAHPSNNPSPGDGRARTPGPNRDCSRGRRRKRATATGRRARMSGMRAYAGLRAAARAGVRVLRAGGTPGLCAGRRRHPRGRDGQKHPGGPGAGARRPDRSADKTGDYRRCLPPGVGERCGGAVVRGAASCAAYAACAAARGHQATTTVYAAWPRVASRPPCPQDHGETVVVLPCLPASSSLPPGSWLRRSRTWWISSPMPMAHTVPATSALCISRRPIYTGG